MEYRSGGLREEVAALSFDDIRRGLEDRILAFDSNRVSYDLPHIPAQEVMRSVFANP
jgi:hypothetical protein